MKDCTTCGNEIESSARKCPYCEQPQTRVSSEAKQRVRRTIVTVNLEEGRPFVEEALERMDRQLYEARTKGISVVRLIHGYGSSGTGGAIKRAVRKELESALQHGSIKHYVTGEDYQHSEIGRNLRSRFSELKEELRTDQGNPGITLVEV
jgi:protoheme ferro-lyase